MKYKIWTISNFISFLRILSVFPIGWLLWNDCNVTAFWVALAGGALTDNLDGYFARKFNQITEFGKIIDPLADKIFLGGIVIILLMKNAIPLEFVLAVLGRDLLILLAGIFLSSRIKSVPPSNAIGKITVTVVGINIGFYMLNWHPIAEYSLWLSYFMLIYSLVSYTQRLFKLMKNPE